MNAPSQAAARGVVRQRAANELDPCVWAGPDGLQVDVQKVRLRSTASTDESVISFINDTDAPVRAIWINFSGHEVEYTVIEARQKRRYRTYLSHPWIMRDAGTGERMMLEGRMVVISTTRDQEVRISAAPQLPWTTKNHTHYPTQFKNASKALLLSHHRARYIISNNQCTMERKPSWAIQAYADESSITKALVPDFDLSLVKSVSTSLPACKQAIPLTVDCRANDLPASAHYPHHWDPVPRDLVPPLGPPAYSGTTSPIARAARMLGWVVDKMVKRPAVQTTLSQSPVKSAVCELPADGLVYMADLPTDLVTLIISFLAPDDVRQCVTRGSPTAHPDILPALLASDPATWPSVAMPTELPAA